MSSHISGKHPKRGEQPYKTNGGLWQREGSLAESTRFRPTGAAARGTLLGMMTEERPLPKPAKARKLLSVPLSPERHAELERLAGRQPVSAYVREQLFPANDNAPASKRQPRGMAPVKDHAALAKILAAMGKSDAGSSLRAMTHLARMGALPITPETEAAILKACADIADMKALLMKALGIRER